MKRGLTRITLGMLVTAGTLASHSSPAVADVYKYVDPDGNVFFSDEPLQKADLRLEWKRTATRLVEQNKEQSERLHRERAAAQALLDARLKSRSAASDIYAARPVGPVSGSMSVRRARYHGLIESVARRHGLMPELLHAVIRTESAYKPDALSHAGACGLMQLMPATAARFRVTDIWDPAENIRGGATYLRFLLDYFDNDIRLALAGYNAGENAVRRYGNQIPPYRETQDYVRKVLQFLWAEGEARQS